MTKRTTIDPAPRPFLKWAGGKGQLLAELVKRVDAAGSFGRYHEPFVGGAALFFELCATGKLKKKALLSDSNANLIEAYLGLRQSVEEVVALLETHALQHSQDHYYATRVIVPKTLPERAARIIYLNRTCFNGLYRENSSGRFNVPMGRYDNPRICDAPNLRAVASALRKADIECRPFETVLDRAKPGDLVYFDPPYHPVSKTSSFTAYAKGGFGEEHQRHLAQVFRELAERGVKAILSNSMTDFVRDLYADFRIDAVDATRRVNSKADRRGKIPEALIVNW
jgi:DNA adenine methylase